jgi:hypothetical protein
MQKRNDDHWKKVRDRTFLPTEQKLTDNLSVTECPFDFATPRILNLMRGAETSLSRLELQEKVESFE